MQVEDNIPIPVKGNSRRKFKFEKLEKIGQSFLTPCGIADNKRTTNLIYACFHQFEAKYQTGIEITCRAVKGGIRTWRTK